MILGQFAVENGGHCDTEVIMFVESSLLQGIPEAISGAGKSGNNRFIPSFLSQLSATFENGVMAGGCATREGGKKQHPR